jgi:ethanolamine utilization cobalamin adenosyltransferase
MKLEKETVEENKPAMAERLGRTKRSSKRPNDEASKGKPQFLTSREQNQQTENDQKLKLTTRVKIDSFIEIQIDLHDPWRSPPSLPHFDYWNEK